MKRQDVARPAPLPAAPLLIMLLVTATPLPAASLTCDPGALDARSYRLTTRAVALEVNEERTDWRRERDLGRVQGDLEELNSGVARAAARALELDPRNLMAHSLIARQALLDYDAETAARAARRVFDAGGAIAWTATLYDVDARTYFLMAF